MQPWGRGRDIPWDPHGGNRDSIRETRAPPALLVTPGRTGSLRPALGPPPGPDRTGCRRGSRGERKGGPAGAPLPEGASPASSAPAPAGLTFRSFSGRYLHSRAISTYLSKSRGAILEITSPYGGGGSGGGSSSGGGSGGGRSRNSSYVTSGP